jgi:hypothetical protein
MIRQLPFLGHTAHRRLQHAPPRPPLFHLLPSLTVIQKQPRSIHRLEMLWRRGMGEEREERGR